MVTFKRLTKSNIHKDRKTRIPLHNKSNKPLIHATRMSHKITMVNENREKRVQIVKFYYTDSGK